MSVEHQMVVENPGNVLAQIPGEPDLMPSCASTGAPPSGWLGLGYGKQNIVVITAEWLHEHKTANGGWTSKQLALLGVNCKGNPSGDQFWQPEKNWLKNIVGTNINDAIAKQFEEAKHIFVA